MQYTGIFRKTILVAAIAAAFASPAQAATPISGNYSAAGATRLFGHHTLTSGNLNLDNGHTLVIEPGASLLYSGGWQRGQGWVRLDLDASGDTWWSGGRVDNRGLFTISGNGINDVIRNSFGQGSFNNSGTFRKTGSDANHVTRIDALFQSNGGRVEVQSGILSFERDSSHSRGPDQWAPSPWWWGGHWVLGSNASIDIASGATLRFAGGSHSLNNTNIGGSGTLSLTGGSVSTQAALTVDRYDQSAGHFNQGQGSISTSAFTLSGGSFNSQGSISTSAFTLSGGSFNNQGSINTSAFTQSGGTFSVFGDLTVTGAASFSGRTTQSGGAITRLQGASTLTSGHFGLDAGRTLINDNTGVFTWSGGALDLDSDYSTRFDGGGFLNHGEFIASGNEASVIRNSAGAGIFDNTGTFRKTGSSADHVTHIDALFLNAGTVAVETGSLRMNGGFINDAGQTH